MDCPKPNRPPDPRLQKVLAACGFGSRRYCETLIASGRVSIDGTVVTELGIRADPERQTVTVDGQRVHPQAFEYILLNKPRGFLCTSRDPRGRKTFHDLLPPLDVRVVSAGRLDGDSEGLLLVTNDGDLIQNLIHPRGGVEKVYEVELDGPLTPLDVRHFLDGISIEGALHQALAVQPLDRHPGGTRYEIILKQGLNRQIRRMAEAVGRRVLRLRRIRLGPLALGTLPTGGWRRLQRDELLQLKNRSSSNAACESGEPKRRVATSQSGPGKRGAI